MKKVEIPDRFIKI